MIALVTKWQSLCRDIDDKCDYLDWTIKRIRILTFLRYRKITLTLARGHLAAPETAHSAHSALRPNQHVTVRTDVLYRGAYRPSVSHDRGVLRFLRTTAGRRSCEQIGKLLRSYFYERREIRFFFFYLIGDRAGFFAISKTKFSTLTALADPMKVVKIAADVIPEPAATSVQHDAVLLAIVVVRLVLAPRWLLYDLAWNSRPTLF